MTSSDPYAGPATAPGPERPAPRDLPWSRRGLAAGPLLALAAGSLLLAAWSLVELLVERLAAWFFRGSAGHGRYDLAEPTASPYLAVLGVALAAAVPCVAFVLVQRRLRVGPEALAAWALAGAVLGVAAGAYLATAVPSLFDVLTPSVAGDR